VAEVSVTAQNFFVHGANAQDSLRTGNTAGSLSSTKLEIGDLSALTVNGKNVGGVLGGAATQVVTASAIQNAAVHLTGKAESASSAGGEITNATEFQEVTTTLVSEVAQDLLQSGANPQAVNQITEEFNHEIESITQGVVTNGGSSRAIDQGLSSFVEAAEKILNDSALQYSNALDELEHAAESGEYSKEEAIAWHKLIGYSGARLAMDGFVVSFGDACSLIAKANRVGYEDDLRAQQAKNAVRHSINSLGIYGKWQLDLTKEGYVDAS
jgi:hypothetical protein